MIHKNQTVRWKDAHGNMVEGEIVETLEEDQIENEDGVIKVDKASPNEVMYLIEDEDGEYIKKYASEVEIF